MPPTIASNQGTEPLPKNVHLTLACGDYEILRGDDTVVAERIIDTYVRRLRRKMEAIDPAFDRIETVVGAGYRWKE